MARPRPLLGGPIGSRQGSIRSGQRRASGFAGTVAINISPILFRRNDFQERLFEHARFANAGLDSLDFEITETGIMDQPSRAAHVLGELRDHGSKVSVDDFGTGHSSPACLADLPVDVIKIDKLFVQNMDRSWGAAVVGAAATLGSKLGLETVAEGIGRASELELCRELGVIYGKGFHLAPPCTAMSFADRWTPDGGISKLTSAPREARGARRPAERRGPNGPRPAPDPSWRTSASTA